MIYAQSGFLYEIIPNALCSSFDPKVKPGPHADSIVGCVSAKPMDRLQNKLVNCHSTNLLRENPWLRLNPPKRRVCFQYNRQTRRVTSSLDRIKRRVRIIVRVGIGMRMLIIMTRMPVMLGGDKQAKRKVKFPCKLCKDDRLTYLFPRNKEASRFLAQGPAVLTNPLLHNQNMNSKSHE